MGVSPSTNVRKQVFLNNQAA